MLPHAPLRLGLTEIKGVSVPAREVGGDFFNYFQVPERPDRAARRRRLRQGRRRRAADGEHPGVAAHAARARPGSLGARRRDRSRHRSELARPRLRDALRRHSQSGHRAVALRERRSQSAVRAAQRRRPRAHVVDRPAGRPLRRAAVIPRTPCSSPPATCSSSTPTAASRPRTKPATCSEPNGSKRCSRRSTARRRRRPHARRKRRQRVPRHAGAVRRRDDDGGEDRVERYWYSALGSGLEP